MCNCSEKIIPTSILILQCLQRHEYVINFFFYGIIVTKFFDVLRCCTTRVFPNWHALPSESVFLLLNLWQCISFMFFILWWILWRATPFTVKKQQTTHYSCLDASNTLCIPKQPNWTCKLVSCNIFFTTCMSRTTPSDWKVHEFFSTKNYTVCLHFSEKDSWFNSLFLVFYWLC